MYVHFQKRKMTVKDSVGDTYIAFPNEIHSVESIEQKYEIISNEISNYWDYKKEKKETFKFIILRFIYEKNKLKLLKYMIRKRL